MIKLTHILEDLPITLKDLESTIDINDEPLDKIFADHHGLEDGSGAPSPMAGVELDTIKTHLNPDDDIATGYTAVGGSGEEGDEDHVFSGLPKPSSADADDGDALEEELLLFMKDLVEADINMKNVFMKGVGPGGEPNPDQLTDEPEKEVTDVLDTFEKDIKHVDLEPKKVDEALGLTLAGVALSMPEIIKLIGKLINLLKKIPFLNKLSGDKLIAIGDKYHHKITGAFEFIIKKAGVKDTTKAKKFASILHHVVIAMLLIAGGISMSGLVTQGSLKGATLKGALNAIKAKELKTFIIAAAAKTI